MSGPSFNPPAAATPKRDRHYDDEDFQSRPTKRLRDLSPSTNDELDWPILFAQIPNAHLDVKQDGVYNIADLRSVPGYVPFSEYSIEDNLLSNEINEVDGRQVQVKSEDLSVLTPVTVFDDYIGDNYWDEVEEAVRRQLAMKFEARSVPAPVSVSDDFIDGEDVTYMAQSHSVIGTQPHRALSEDIIEDNEIWQDADVATQEDPEINSDTLSLGANAHTIHEQWDVGTQGITNRDYKSGMTDAAVEYLYDLTADDPNHIERAQAIIRRILRELSDVLGLYDAAAKRELSTTDSEVTRENIPAYEDDIEQVCGPDEPIPSIEDASLYEQVFVMTEDYFEDLPDAESTADSQSKLMWQHDFTANIHVYGDKNHDADDSEIEYSSSFKENIAPAAANVRKPHFTMLNPMDFTKFPGTDHGQNTQRRFPTPIPHAIIPVAMTDAEEEDNSFEAFWNDLMTIMFPTSTTRRKSDHASQLGSKGLPKHHCHY